jgi:hypothetical protein
VTADFVDLPTARPRQEAVDSAMLACAVGLLDRVLGRTPERNRPLDPDRPRRFTLDACVVHAGGLLSVVGDAYRQEELRALAARTTDAGEFREELVDYAAEVADSEPDRRWFRAVLVREPDNPKDDKAIAVYSQGGGKVGYLRREDARRYGQVFESLEKPRLRRGSVPRDADGRRRRRGLWGRPGDFGARLRSP